MLASDIMTTEVVSVKPDEDVSDVARLLLGRRISAVPVVERDGRMVGIVSEGDLIRRAEAGERSWWLALLADRTAEFTRTFGTRARDVMTSQVISVSDEAPIAEVARILEENGIKRVPVLRNNRLAGIVSRADVLRGLAAMGNRPQMTTSADDRQIQARITDLIRRETSASLEAVSVIVVDGVVYLWGTADNDTDKEAIRVAAENVAGVARVHDFTNTLQDVLGRI